LWYGGFFITQFIVWQHLPKDAERGLVYGRDSSISLYLLSRFVLSLYYEHCQNAKNVKICTANQLQPNEKRHEYQQRPQAKLIPAEFGFRFGGVFGMHCQATLNGYFRHQIEYFAKSRRK
jgi:hypothetical protein